MPERRFFCRRAGRRTRAGGRAAAATKSAGELSRAGAKCVSSRDNAKGDGKGQGIALTREPGRRFSRGRRAGERGTGGKSRAANDCWMRGLPFDAWHAGENTAEREKRSCGALPAPDVGRQKTERRVLRRVTEQRRRGNGFRFFFRRAGRSARRKGGYHGACRHGGASCAKKERAWAFW